MTRQTTMLNAYTPGAGTLSPEDAALAERRASWQRFAADAKVGVLMLPLTAMDATAHAAALRRLLGLDADTPA